MSDIRPGPASFDPANQSWLLSSYADVAAALCEPRLSPSATSSFAASPIRSDSPAVGRWPGADAQRAWSIAARQSAIEAAGRLDVGGTVDLIEHFAAPWSLALATRLTGVADGDASTLVSLAREVFLAAAHATSAEPTASQLAAVGALAVALQAQGPGGPLAVQSFVALSQTLPATLGAVWLALIEHAEEASTLRTEPGLMSSAVEELLRFAGPSRAGFRIAHEDIAIGAATIARGERVVLLIGAANRDPARFLNPDRLDLRRNGAGHLALGRGEHSCVGASVIRAAVGGATAALLDATVSIELAGAVEWIDGYAIRAPRNLPVRLTRAPY